MATTAKENGKAKPSKGAKMLAEYIKAHCKSYDAAVIDIKEKTKVAIPKASLSHWIVGIHRPSIKGIQTMERWAGIPLNAWMEG